MSLRTLPLVIILVLSGCDFKTNEELQMQKMVSDFMVAVQNNDESAAHSILLDMAGFRTLNPDISARVDASSFTDAVLSDLVTNFREMNSFFQGKKVKVTAFHIGGQWYQYKGFPAFKDNEVELDADGETVKFTIRGIVKLDDKWRIVDLSDNGLY